MEEIIIAKNKYKFISWLFISFLNISQKTLLLQKEFNYSSTLLFTSKSQKKLEYHKGVSQSIRTSQRFFKRKYDTFSIEYNTMLKDSSNIIWIDNYSKFYKLSSPS